MWTQLSLWFKIYNYLYACYRPSETWNFFYRSGGPVTNKFYWTFITFTGPTKFGTNFIYSYWCFAFHFYFQFHFDCSRSTILDALHFSQNLWLPRFSSGFYFLFPCSICFFGLPFFTWNSSIIEMKEVHCLSKFL